MLRTAFHILVTAALGAVCFSAQLCNTSDPAEEDEIHCPESEFPLWCAKAAVCCTPGHFAFCDGACYENVDHAQAECGDQASLEVCVDEEQGNYGGGDGFPCGSENCEVDEICVSTQACVINMVGSGCDCSDHDTTCVDLSAFGLDRCGTCGAGFNACCPGTMCVNGGGCHRTCPP